MVSIVMSDKAIFLRISIKRNGNRATWVIPHNKNQRFSPIGTSIRLNYDKWEPNEWLIASIYTAFDPFLIRKDIRPYISVAHPYA